MEVVGYKSNRLLVTNCVVLAIAILLAVLIGIFASSKVLAIIPVVLAIANISMIVEFCSTPKGVILIDGDDLIIKKAWKKEDRFEIRKIVSIVFTKYSAKSNDGILSIDLEYMDKPINIPSLNDVETVRARIFEKRKEYSFDNVLDIANSENSTTSKVVNDNIEENIIDDEEEISTIEEAGSKPTSNPDNSIRND